MDLNQLIGDFTIFKKNIDSTAKLLKDISHLDQDRMKNLPQLKARLAKLDIIIKRLDQSAYPRDALANWADQYKRDLANSDELINKRFGVELEQEMKKRGLSLSGQYPDLRAGLFIIELNFDKGKVALWYGPKQERLDQCNLSVMEVITHIEKVKQQLGSHLDEPEFLKRLQDAYAHAAGTYQDKTVPIIKVLSELAYILQSPQFHNDPRRENYRAYTRADFSYDLFRVRQSKQHTLFGKNLHLSVATRAHTKRRQDFLWVPDDESGKGTTYSHLQFKEVT